MNGESSDVKIWRRGNREFLAIMSYYWIFSNRIFEFLLVVGVIVIFFFDGWFKYVGVVIALYSIITLFYRRGLHDGFYESYEHGFSDAAGKGGIGTSEQELTIAKGIALEEIEKREHEITEEARQNYADVFKKGLKNYNCVLIGLHFK